MKFLFLLGFSLSALAADPMCVRNYAKQGAESVCENQKQFYASVTHLINAESKVCTRIYADFYCETAPKEYQKVMTTDRREICTLNYNQPPVANFCESVPEFYDYIQRKPSE